MAERRARRQHAQPRHGAVEYHGAVLPVDEWRSEPLFPVGHDPLARDNGRGNDDRGRSINPGARRGVESDHTRAGRRAADAPGVQTHATVGGGTHGGTTTGIGGAQDAAAGALAAPSAGNVPFRRTAALPAARAARESQRNMNPQEC